MKTAGIVCEFNPFHYGHKYLIETVKKEFDAVVCIMSGSFVQRGEAALYDKWTRCEAALLNGADLVIELPVRFALSSAKGFSMGSISLLAQTGIVDSVCFGCECCDTDELIKTSEILSCEPPEVSEKIKELMARGQNYPKARAEAFKGLVNPDIISQPNNILALEYISAVKNLNTSMKVYPIKRYAVDHDSPQANGNFASASFLRDAVKNGRDISAYTPYDFTRCTRYDTDKLTPIFKYKLISMRDKIFDNIPDAEPGLAEHFFKAINEPTLSDIIESVKTKRYTYTRLRRVALSAVLNIHGGYKNPEYLRILGMNDTGKALLSDMRKKASLPLVNKTADFKSPMFNEDIYATNIAALCSDRQVLQNSDYFNSPIIINNN